MTSVRPQIQFRLPEEVYQRLLEDSYRSNVSIGQKAQEIVVLFYSDARPLPRPASGASKVAAKKVPKKPAKGPRDVPPAGWPADATVAEPEVAEDPYAYLRKKRK